MRWLAACLAVAMHAQAPSVDSLLQQFAAKPNDWKLCNQIAVLYTQTQDFDRAAEYFHKVTVLNPAFTPARKNLAVVLWFGGHKAEALPLFRQLARAIPADPVPHLYLGIAAHEARQFAEARTQFAAAGDLAFDNPEVLPAAVDASLATGDTAVVARALAVAGAMSDLSLTARLAAVFNQRQQYQATVQLLEPRPRDSTLLPLLAEAYDKTNRAQDAYAAYQQAIDRDPGHEAGYTALAAFAAAHQNNKYALEVLDRGAARLPRSSGIQLHRGLLLALEGNREAAAQSFERAAELDPQSSLPVLSLGVLNLESGHPAEAAGAFRNAVRQFPREPLAPYFLALALSRTGVASDRAAALEAARKAVELSPDSSAAQALLGRVSLDAGQPKAGIAALERSVQLDPANLTARYRLAQAYRQSGQTALAERHMAEFRKGRQKADEEPSGLVQILKVLR